MIVYYLETTSYEPVALTKPILLAISSSDSFTLLAVAPYHMCIL
jgi:hypothetical protein